MTAANTDKWRKVQRNFSTTLASTLAQSATTAALASTTGLPTDTAVSITINRVDANGTATPASEEVITGVVSGSNVQNLLRGAEGTTDQEHSAGSVVEMVWTETVWNDAVDGFLVEHKQAGTHGAITADSIVIADAGTLDVDTINEATTANGVAVDGMTIKDGLVVGGSGVGVNNTSLDTANGALGGAWQTWTYNGAGFGSNVTYTGKYIQIGKTVRGWFKATLTGAPSSVTNVTFDAPVTAASDANFFGVSTLKDLGSLTYVGSIELTSTTEFKMRVVNDDLGSGSANNALGTPTTTVPMTWANGDSWYGNFEYEAA